MRGDVCLMLAMVAALGCNSETITATQVMVSVTADPATRMATRRVHVAIRSGQGESGGWEERYDATLDVGSAEAWPLELSLLPKNGDATRVYEVTATAQDGSDKAIAKVRAISGFRPQRALSLTLRFDDECLGKALECSATQTCRAGACEDAHVLTTELLNFDPERADLVPFDPRSDAGGDATVDAAVDAGGPPDGAAGPGVDAASDASTDAAVSSLDSAVPTDAGMDSGPTINACGGVGPLTCSAPPCTVGASCASAASDGNGNVCVTCTNKPSSETCCVPSQCGTWAWTWKCNGGTSLRCSNGLAPWDGCGL